MKTKTAGLFASAALGLALSTSASAMLIDRGNGMIYDSDQNLTWLQDANYAQSSGYDNDGLMSWSEATSWADGLNYGGYDDWRLATVTDDNNNGCAKDDGSYDPNNGSDCGFNVDTSNSELAYMWYNILGNTPSTDTSGNYPQSGWGLTSTSADGVDMLNIQSNRFWLDMEYAPDTGNAWFFDTDDGYQGYFSKGSEMNAWAVRSGDVAAAVPEPGTLLLLAAGLAGIASAKRRRCL